MAERRMFAKQIIDSDAFLDMPLSTQALYFHLSMRADDEGFINNPKKIMRMMGASQNELELLLAKRYVLAFDSGVVVIKHWKIHNYIQKDRFKETLYHEEREQIKLKDNRSYTENKPMYPECIQNGDTGKVRVELEENREYNNTKEIEKEFTEWWNHYPKKADKKKAHDKYIKLHKGKYLIPLPEHIEIIEKWKKTEQWKGGFIPNPTTWLNGYRWEDEIPTEKENEHNPGVTIARPLEDCP